MNIEQEIMNLTDDELDCAVAVAQGLILKGEVMPWYINKITNKGICNEEDYHPSTNGQQLLEIMEREKISVKFVSANKWEAYESRHRDAGFPFYANGNTINQAVLRCYLLSKQGGNNG